MSDVKKIATRESYGKTLVELGREDKDLVVMDADLAGANKTGMFRKEFPERFFNAGIAEADMVSIAAGLAACGKKPFISSFAMFATGRAYEQIRNSIAYPRLNVKICASHAGISVGEDGASHQCVEDISLMRSIPGMVVVNPADDIEAKAAIRALYEYEGPAYCRLGRAAVPVINEGNADYKFELGKGITIKDGNDVTLIATGLCVSSAIDAAELLEKDGISTRIINIHTIKPLDNDIIVKAAKETKTLITVEEHSVIGGLGSAVCDCLAEYYPCRLKKIGIQDVFGHSGSCDALIKEYQLDGQGIYEQVKAYLKTL